MCGGALMKFVTRMLLTTAVVAIWLLPQESPSQTALPLRSVAEIPLSGGTSRMDYESFDSQAHLLFIAHMGAGQVIAFDTAGERVAATIDDTPTVRGVLAVPSLHRVYAAARGIRSVVDFDERSFRIVARVGNTQYDAAS